MFSVNVSLPFIHPKPPDGSTRDVNRHNVDVIELSPYLEIELAGHSAHPFLEKGACGLCCNSPRTF